MYAFMRFEMRIILLSLALLVSGCAVHKQMPAEEMVIRKEIELEGMTRERIFDISKMWITRHLYAKDKIITTADRNAGVIIANGYIDYPETGKLDALDKIQYTISFTMREEIQDSGATITFYDLMLDIPKYYRYTRWWPMQEYGGGYSVPIEEKADFEAARRGLRDNADRLADYLKQARHPLSR
jgi:hypothetical protein